MAARNPTHDDNEKLSDDYLSTAISSSTLEIILDDQLFSSSDDDDDDDDDSSSHARRSKVNTTGNDRSKYRRQKKSPLQKDPKSHRLIEKRRRDRMNACLDQLLELTPHEHPETQRRIEKTEIIEMAIKHMRHLTAVSNKNGDNADLDTYRSGYRTGVSDLSHFLDDYSDLGQLRSDITKYLQDKELELKHLTVLPRHKRPTSLTRSDKKVKLSTPSSTIKLSPDHGRSSQQGQEALCVISQVEEYKPNDSRTTKEPEKILTPSPTPMIKVPIFVLHPSGTHYIPMSIDASLVSHAFNKTSSPSASASPTEQVPCHPVSIPVNFNPTTSFSDPYELDVQNINVIATRHQTSVRPN